MNIQFSFLGAVLFVLIACGSVFGQAQAKRQIEWRVAARRKSHKRLPNNSMEPTPYSRGSSWRYTFFLPVISKVEGQLTSKIRR
jgi:hypothetical protein